MVHKRMPSICFFAGFYSWNNYELNCFLKKKPQATFEIITINKLIFKNNQNIKVQFKPLFTISTKENFCIKSQKVLLSKYTLSIYK